MSETKNIQQRLNAIMRDAPKIQKEDKRVNNQYTFVSHDSVTNTIKPLLVKHGVNAYISEQDILINGNKVELDLKVRFTNIDNPSDFVEVPSFGFGIDNQDKGPGKAISYAYKYALLKTFALETGDDVERDNITFKPRTDRAIISVNREKLRKELFTLIKKHYGADNLTVSQVDSFLEKYGTSSVEITKMGDKEFSELLSELAFDSKEGK